MLVAASVKVVSLPQGVQTTGRLETLTQTCYGRNQMGSSSGPPAYGFPRSDLPLVPR